ncbi:MAG: hypothetical protein P0Y51_25395 [Candidatus Pseudomonas colombiensis]|nr:MAG: hypothetical protein P0Y51_25395 [Pseudomonas sp.]
MQSLHWHDLKDLQGQWAGLGFQVEGAVARPALHVQAYRNGRIRLMLGSSPLFWATLARNCSGWWLVKNPHGWEQGRLLPGLNAADVQRHAQLAPEQRLQAWSRFFVRQLSEHLGDFFYPGFWLARALPPVGSNRQVIERNGLSAWSFRPIRDAHHHLPGYGLEGANFLDTQQPGSVQWLNWVPSGLKLITLHPVDPVAGRLKWWRKTAREGCLPPILLWFVASLDSYVVIDGHYRLQAAIDENLPPSFIVLSTTQVDPISPCPEHQQRVLDSLLKRGDAPARNRLTYIESVNDALIQAFDDRPEYNCVTHAWASTDSEPQWCEDVRRCLTEQGLGDQAESVIGRQHPL